MNGLPLIKCLINFVFFHNFQTTNKPPNLKTLVLKFGDLLGVWCMKVDKKYKNYAS